MISDDYWVRVELDLIAAAQVDLNERENFVVSISDVRDAIRIVRDGLDKIGYDRPVTVLEAFRRTTFDDYYPIASPNCAVRLVEYHAVFSSTIEDKE